MGLITRKRPEGHALLFAQLQRTHLFIVTILIEEMRLIVTSCSQATAVVLHLPVISQQPYRKVADEGWPKHSACDLYLSVITRCP